MQAQSSWRRGRRWRQAAASGGGGSGKAHQRLHGTVCKHAPVLVHPLLATAGTLGRPGRHAGLGWHFLRRPAEQEPAWLQFC